MKMIFKLLFRVFLSIGIAFSLAGLIIILYANAKLPSVENLEDAQLQVPLRIYTQDGKLIGEYGEKRRTPISISEVPEKLKLAILATEDRRFYEHNGVDLRGLLRASVNLIARGRKEQGASTITMQVARNFYLTRKKTFTRKLNEILLAMKIEKELSKDQILELYLNKIYFGKRAYGVQAAAYVYYGKSVQDLSLAQMAMLAGLPQAPSAINPLNNRAAALKRRGHVLNRMKHYEFISSQEFEIANNAPLTAKFHGRRIEAQAPYIAEMARQWAFEHYGKKVYTQGFEIYTTVNSTNQQAANDAVTDGLLAYDKRHGYRGPRDTIEINPQEQDQDFSSLLKPYSNFGKILPALVTKVDDEQATAYLRHGQPVSLSFNDMTWARPVEKYNYLGRQPKSAHDVVNIGDVIYVEPKDNRWILSQIPKATAALVSLNPKNGAVMSLVGGFDFKLSKFNRATQARRQPGSNFKPIIYSAALERGLTAATIINDAPVVFNDPTLEGVWRPQNDSRRFYGPTRLRVGLTKSRNLVSIRLLKSLGLQSAIEVVERFGIDRHRLPNGLSLALGTVSLTPLEIATSYAVFANGGYKIEPYFIQTVKTLDNDTLYEAKPLTVCDTCELTNNFEYFFDESSSVTPEFPEAPTVLSSQTAYIMDSILKDAIQSGTGRKAKQLKRKDIAGKTGTTNQQMDAWYSGYNPSVITTVWVGHDELQSLREYGAQAALPIWIDYMGTALEDTQETYLPEPPGIMRVRIDPKTGLLAHPEQTNAIFEIFKEENVPTKIAPLLAKEPQISITPSSNEETEALF